MVGIRQAHLVTDQYIGISQARLMRALWTLGLQLTFKIRRIVYINEK